MKNRLTLIASLFLCFLLLAPISPAQKGGGHSGHSSAKASSKSSSTKASKSSSKAEKQYLKAEGKRLASERKQRARDEKERLKAEKKREKEARAAQEKHAKRSEHAKAEFVKMHPCPSTGKKSGPCPGYVVDHIKALAVGGPDDPSNMQWQTTAAAKAKDKIERKP